jgi:NitT/TauT family transport system permease protein
MSIGAASSRSKSGTPESTVQSQVRATTDARQRRDRRQRLLLPIGLVVLVLLAWEILGRIIGFDPLFFSYPSQIGAALGEYAQAKLWSDLGASALEFAIGMVIALVAIPIGLVIGRSRKLVYALNPVIDALYSTPIVALTPLFVIWFGLGITSKVAMVAVVAFFPLLITMIEGVRTFGASRLQTYVDVIVPGTLPFIISGIRLSIRGGIIGVVLGEFLGATGGVGYRIRVFADAFRTPDYLAGVAVLVVFAVFLNLLLKFVERRVAPWRRALSEN